MAKRLQRRRSSAKKEFSPAEMNDLRTAFDLLDRNQDGKISVNELQFMLQKLGIDVREEVIQELIKDASHTGIENLNETEFMQWVKKIQDLLPEETEDDITKDLIAAFKVFDADQDGYITRNEVKKAMEMIGEPVTENQITEFISIADIDKDGKINYEEFAKLLL